MHMQRQHFDLKTKIAFTTCRVNQFFSADFKIKLLLLVMSGLVHHSPAHAAANQAPRFSVRHAIARPDSGVIIVAQNRAALRQQPLVLEFDGVKLETAAPLISTRKNEYCWLVKPAALKLSTAQRRDGVHYLRVAYAGETWSSPLQIVWHTQPPRVEATVSKIAGSEQVTIMGRVASSIPLPGYDMSVVMLLGVASVPLCVAVPAARAPDSAGLRIFTFRATIQGVPKIGPEEAAFVQPFWGLLVTGPAGNRFYDEESYAWFSAPGHKRLDPTPGGSKTLLKSAALPAHLIETAGPPKPPDSGARKSRQPESALQLQVRPHSARGFRLQWSPPPAIRADELQLAVVWRDEQPLALCFNTEYLDSEATVAPGHHYQVALFTRAGGEVSSNVATVEPAPAVWHASAATPPLFAQAFGPEAAAACATKSSGRDQTVIAEIVSRHKLTIQDCYQRGLRRDYTLKGKVVVRFVVTPQGTVARAEILTSTLNNNEVEDCILDRIKRWNDFGVNSEKGDFAFKQTYLFGY